MIFLEIDAFVSAKLYWGIKHINWEQDCLVGDITSLVVSVCGSKQCVENCNYLQCIASKYKTIILIIQQMYMFIDFGY